MSNRITATSLAIFITAAIGFTGCQKSAQERLAEKILENIDENPQRDAITLINTLKTACKMYKLNVGKFPPNLEALATAPDGMDQKQWRGPYLDTGRVPTDPWDSQFIYSTDDAGDRVIITSAGPDRQPGTNDDLPSTNPSTP